MLHASHDCTSNLQPINAIIQLLIHKSYHDHIIPSDQIQTMFNLA